MKKLFQANGRKKQAGVVIFIPDKIDIKPKGIWRDKEEYYISSTNKNLPRGIEILNTCGQGHSGS